MQKYNIELKNRAGMRDGIKRTFKIRRQQNERKINVLIIEVFVKFLRVRDLQNK